MKTFILILLFSTSLFAEVLKKNAAGDFVLTKNSFKMSELIADYGKLMGLNLSVYAHLKDESFEAVGELVIPKDQLEGYVSTILNHNFTAMIRKPDSRFVQIIDARDIRYSSVPVYTKLEDIPDNDNQAQYSHVLKYLDSSELARNMRPFLSRYGRLIDMREHTIHITDTGKNLRRIGLIANHIDTEEFQKSKKEIEAINEKHKQEKTKTKSFYEILTKNESIFILIFFLIGSIIGFGSRGYMMKKVEGGW